MCDGGGSHGGLVAEVQLHDVGPWGFLSFSLTWYCCVLLTSIPSCNSFLFRVC